MNFPTIPTSLFSIVICLIAGSANSSVIIFDLQPDEGFLGSSYSQDGFNFFNTNDCTCSANNYGNWVALGDAAFNAASTPDIFANYASSSNIITSLSHAPFEFRSIGLASVLNDGTGGDVQFVFKYADGAPPETQTVTLLAGVKGLQTFTFTQSDLSSVTFTPQTTEGPWIQFDDVDAGVPETPGWIMMLIGFGVVGASARRRRHWSIGGPSTPPLRRSHRTC